MQEISEEQKAKVIQYYKKLGINLLILFVVLFATFLSYMFNYLAISLVLSAAMGYIGVKQVSLFTQKKHQLRMDEEKSNVKKPSNKEKRRKKGKKQ
ncbi:MAG: hypothetical protein HQK84_06670 [Nitrospinae bacterium]|nr:hypothetical protein [Nitrospinota bacterium]